MQRIIATILLSILVLGVVSCVHQPLPRRVAADTSGFVYVAIVNPEMADHVDKVLKRSGIHAVIEGSVVYGVSVPSGSESRAASLLRADSAREKYWIRFP